MKQAGFLNLSPKESKELDHQIFLNAKNLLKDANLLYRNSSITSATSLLILSSEEIIKALLVLLHSEGFDVYKIKGAKNFFLSHRVRHEIAELMEVGAGFYEYFHRWEKNRENPVFKTPFKGLNSFLNSLHTIFSMKEPLQKIKSQIESLERFDSWKNMGFYVDYKNGLLLPKKQITEEVYKNTEVTVERIFHYYKMFRILLHPKAKNHLSAKNISYFKFHLNGLINESFVKAEIYEFNKRPKSTPHRRKP